MSVDEKQEKALVSIIIPVYNVERYLSVCVDSVCMQTYNTLEIILVDDGSTDNSGNICDLYAKKDTRITVLHKENGGLSSARNSGLNIAKGVYCYFLDSDDYLSENAIEILIQAAERTASDITIGGFCKVVDDSKVGYRTMEKGESVYNREESFLELYKNVEFVVAWNKLYKMKLFHNVRFKDGIINEDEEIILPLFSRSNRVTKIHDCSYFYRQREGSLSVSDAAINNTYIYSVFEKRRKYFNKQGYREVELENAKTVIARGLEYYVLYADRCTAKTLRMDRHMVKRYLCLYKMQLGWVRAMKCTLFLVSRNIFRKIEMMRSVDRPYKMNRRA